jgi:hypothetical protein
MDENKTAEALELISAAFGYFHVGELPNRNLAGNSPDRLLPGIKY